MRSYSFSPASARGAIVASRSWATRCRPARSSHQATSTRYSRWRGRSAFSPSRSIAWPKNATAQGEQVAAHELHAQLPVQLLGVLERRERAVEVAGLGQYLGERLATGDL